jgi:class 3 adenylate cyclase
MTVPPAANSAEPAAPHPQADRAFVGRRRELEVLSARLDQLVSGRGEMVLLHGEPGIGKTRLADEFAAESARRGASVMWGRCWEGGGAPAFWPWMQILRACARDPATATILSRLGPAAADLAALLPEFRAGSGEPDSTLTPSPIAPLTTSGPDEFEQARFRLFSSTVDFLKQYAERAPLVLILDDCHAADHDSLLLLHFVARDLRQAKVMIVATYRDQEVRQSPRLAELFGLLGREGSSIPLRGLSAEDVKQFVEATSTSAAADETIAALSRVTEGNPFFLTEIMQLILAEGRLPGPAAGGDLTGFEIPEGVRVAIRRRLAAASAQANRVLSIASLIGRDFDTELLRAASELDNSTLVQALDEAVRCGLVKRAATPGRFSFSHVLIAETLAGDLSESERTPLHLRIAEAMEQSSADDLNLLPAIASHYLLALPGGDASKAVEYSQRAARRAWEVGALEDASRLHAMALRAMELGRVADPERRCRLLLEMGQAQFFARELEASKRTFVQAAEIAKKIGKPALQANAVLGYASMFSGTGKVARALIQMLEQVLSELGPSDRPERAMLLARLAAEYYWADAAERRSALSREAVEVARRAGDSRTLVVTLYAKYLALWGPDTAEERIAVSAEMARLADEDKRGELRNFQMRAHFLRIGDLLELNEIEAADREIDTYLSLAENLRRSRRGYIELLRAMRALIDGRLTEAERLALESFALGSEFEPAAASNLATQLGMVRREQSRMMEMEPSIRAFIDQNPTLVMARCALALCYVDGDRREDARAQFEHLAKDEFAELPKDATGVAAAVFMSEVCAYLGDTSRAALLYRRLRPWSSRNAMLGSQVFYGPVALYLGMLASAMSRRDEAHEHFETALRMSQRIGARAWVARTQCEYAAMLLGRANPDDLKKALQLLDSALATATSLELTATANKAQALKARAADRSTGDFAVAAPVAAAPATASRTIATILFLDIAGSTENAIKVGDRRWSELLNRYYEVVRGELSKFGGREVNTFGDDFLALFNAPADAVRCACAIRDATRQLGLEIRAGVHTGECEFSPEGKIAGVAIHIGARIVRRAEPGEVVISSTVRDLALGADFTLSEKGVHVLKGVPGEWSLFAADPSESKPETLFRREADIWTVAFKGRVQRLKDSKGLGYIAQLLRFPGREFHCMELLGGPASLGAEEPSAGSLGGRTAQGLSSQEITALGLRRGIPDDAGEMLDAQAKASYRRRLTELREELEDATEAGHSERAEQARAEIESLGRELSRAVGLGGRDRRAAQISERARVNVSRAIRTAIEKLGEQDGPLRKHLDEAIRTGIFCSYVVETANLPSWQF